MPTFSSNDRSRWATIRALVHDHTYAVGERDPNAIWISAVTMFAASRPSKQRTGAGWLRVPHRRRQQPGSPSRLIFKTRKIFEDGWDTIDRVIIPTR